MEKLQDLKERMYGIAVTDSQHVMPGMMIRAARVFASLIRAEVAVQKHAEREHILPAGMGPK